MEFAQRGLRLRLAGVAAPARQRPLGGVRTQTCGAAGQEKRGARAGLGLGEGNGDGGALQRGLRLAGGRPREGRAELCDIPPGGIVK